jgi:hypothetical protein
VATTTFLHVGLPKSGTTYLQAVLSENKARLADRSGLLFPGRNWLEQVRAVRDVRGQKGRGASADDTGAWRSLVEEIAAWEGNAVVSMEWLGGAPTEQVARVVESLAPSRVEVVITARDLARTIPAAWQEFLQNAEVWSWSEFLGSVTSENPRATPAGNMFWSQQDLGKTLAVWRDSVTPEQLHVVTLPQSGAPAGELWSRFARVLGIDGALFDAGGRGSNESLGRESAELMLRLNQVARLREVDWKTYEEMFKQALAKRGLAKRKHVESPQRRLPSDLADWARARTAEQVRAIQASGASVVGDLADLEPVFDPADEDEATSPEAVLEAAVEGLVALGKDREVELERLRRRVEQLSARRRRAAAQPQTLAPKRQLHKAYGYGRAAIRRVRRSE